jgi:TonB family protein
MSAKAWRLVHLRALASFSLLQAVACASAPRSTTVDLPPAVPYRCDGGAPDDSAFATLPIVRDLDALQPQQNDVVTQMPRYPVELRNRGVQGEVRASFTVDSTGRVPPWSIVIESTTHSAFAQAVCDAIPRMTFAPVTAGGRPVPMRVRGMPFSFSLRPALRPDTPEAAAPSTRSTGTRWSFRRRTTGPPRAWPATGPERRPSADGQVSPHLGVPQLSSPVEPPHGHRVRHQEVEVQTG